MPKRKKTSQSSKRVFPKRISSQKYLQQLYLRSLSDRSVSGTLEEKETPSIGSTNYTAPADHALPREGVKPLEEKEAHGKLLKKIGAVLTILVILGGIIYKYADFNARISLTDKELSEFKKETQENINKLRDDFKNDIQHITDRIDRFVEKKQKR